MKSKWLATLAVGVSVGIVGCGSSGTSDSDGLDGSASGGAAAGGAPAAGGAAAGGAPTGGADPGGPSGGAASGGAPAGGADPGGPSGGAASGGTDAGAGGAAAGGSDNTGGSDPGGTGGAGMDPGGDVTRSKGCGVSDGASKMKMGGSAVNGGLSTSTRKSISLSSGNREYIIDIPADYDPDHPYRLIFSWHQAYGSANGNAVGQYPAGNGPNFNAQNYAYFGLHREAMKQNDPAIFVAPQGIGNFPWDYNRDVELFDKVLELVTTNLCIDESRVFSTGFSFGAMMSHALSLGRASKLRGVVTMAPANYNFTQPTNEPAKVAYLSFTGMSDGTCPWVNNEGQKTGGKFCSLTHAGDNGCTIPQNIPTAQNGSKNHVCYEYEGCEEGYPVKVCTFDGGHTPSTINDGMSGGEDGLKAFTPPIAWEFISSL